MSNGSDSTRDFVGGLSSQTPYVLVLAALLGLLAPRAVAPTAEHSTTQATALIPSPPQADAEYQSWEKRLEQMLTDLGDPGEQQVLIATMHDPIDSHLQTYFDADCGSIQRAIQSHGFVRHRYWLPWKDWIYAAANVKDRSAALARDNSPTSERVYEREPGVVLFRRDSPAANGAQQALILLLVGETPTQGIHVAAFKKALDTAEKRSPEIRIIGPSASGTAVSIRQTLNSWRRNPHRNWPEKIAVHLITGSATSQTALAQLQKPATPSDATLTCDIRATVLPDDVTIVQMFRYLTEDRRIDPNQIALLQEADTSYGQGSVRLLEGRFNNVLILRYPMEIGTVRNEYEKIQSLKFGPETPSSAPKLNLNVPWVQPPHARDQLPQFSDTTPAVTERRMGSLFATCARRDIRAIGLLGTDPKDLLYLAQQVRRFCPDVQLFAFENNILFTHADFVRNFKGTIIASTYPSFVNNQEWTRKSPRRTASQFSSGITEGVYNASLAQLEEIYGNDDRTNNSSRATPGAARIKPFLLDYSFPFHPETYGSPPLWISIVGQISIAPVKAIPREDLVSDPTILYSPKATLPPNAQALASLGVPPFTFTCILINLTVVAIAAVFIGRNLQGSTTAKRASPWPIAWPWLQLCNVKDRSSVATTQPRSADHFRYLYAIVLFSGLAAMQLFASSLIRKFSSLPEGTYEDAWPLKVALGLAFAALALCLVSILFSLARLLSQKTKRPISIYRCWASIIGITLVVVAAAIFTFAKSSNDKIATAIEIERWGDIFNGVTPLFPLACLALIPVAWATCHLRRRYFAEIHRLGNPFPRNSAAGLAERLADLDASIGRPWWISSEIRDWFLLGGIVCLSIGLWHRWIATADGIGFDRSLLLLGALSLLLIYCVHVRFMATGGLLERFLRRVAQSPLSEAFSTVPPRLRAKASGQIFSSSPHPGDLNLVILQLENLVSKVPFDNTQLRLCCQRARRRFDRIDRTERANRWAIALSMDSINRPLRKSCRILCEHVLEPTTNAKNSGDSWKEDARTFLATQVTTLIRQSFTHIQNLLVFLTLMLLLFLAAAYSYPFEPQRYISTCTAALILWVVASSVGMFIRLNRNEILSNLSGTLPNRFTADRALIRQLLVFGLVPLLSLLAFQFPEVGNVLFFWVDGLQKAFR